MKKLLLFIAAIILLTVVFTLTNKPTQKKDSSDPEKIKVLKDVGEASMPNFGLSDEDFKTIKKAGFNVIEGNFDICADDSDVKFFLDESRKYGIQVIMPAGSGEAEWGYACDAEAYPVTQKPVWNKKDVLSWIDKWKNDPAVYAWDTSNEAGSVFPNPKDENMLTLEQLKQAYADVKKADPSRPVMIRMNGWFFYDNDDNFFRQGNPFGINTADIVMVNAYSNVDEYYPVFVTTVSTRAKHAIWEIEPKTKIVIALGAWEEKPLWLMPSAQNLKHDIDQLRVQEDLFGVGFFKYGARGSEWYAPENKTLFPIISSY